MMLGEVIENFAPGNSFSLEKVTVLGPYPTPDFFSELRAYKPKEVVLYVDDGVAQSVLDDIKQVFIKKKCRFEYFRVAPETGSGLVHAKVYLFEWKNDEGNQKQQTKRCLLIGSANASLQGFSSHAEAFLCTRVAARSDISGVLKYFDRLREKRVARATDFDLDENSRLWLPAIKIVENDAGESFDSWLRRGILCHKYEPNQNFGKLTINLKKPLPVGDEMKAFVNTGFTQESDSKKLVSPYVNLPCEESDRKAPPWRGQYFLETYFGFWSSEGCYKALQKLEILKSKAHSTREKTLERIRNSSESDRLAWSEQFLKRVQNAADLLGDSACDYLNMKDGRAVDWESYRESANKKLSDDLRLAQDRLFHERYVSGYDFQQVPPLGAHFDGFANSFAISFLRSMQNKSTKNKLGKRMQKLVDKDRSWLENQDSASFIMRLRNDWNDISDSMSGYYQD